jgi:hypothetical protein
MLGRSSAFRAAGFAAALTALCSWAEPAAAYTVGSLASGACHQRMTLNALRAIRADVGAAMPSIAPTGDEQALIDDMPVKVPSDLDDIESATLILSNRDVDLNGVEPGALTELATVQADRVAFRSKDSARAREIRATPR